MVRNRLFFFLNLWFECKSYKKNFWKVIFKKIIMIENLKWFKMFKIFNNLRNLRLGFLMKCLNVFFWVYILYIFILNEFGFRILYCI